MPPPQRRRRGLCHPQLRRSPNTEGVRALQERGGAGHWLDGNAKKKNAKRNKASFQVRRRGGTSPLPLEQNENHYKRSQCRAAHRKTAVRCHTTALPSQAKSMGRSLRACPLRCNIYIHQRLAPTQNTTSLYFRCDYFAELTWLASSGWRALAKISWTI